MVPDGSRQVQTGSDGSTRVQAGSDRFRQVATSLADEEEPVDLNHSGKIVDPLRHCSAAKHSDNHVAFIVAKHTALWSRNTLKTL